MRDFPAHLHEIIELLYFWLGEALGMRCELYHTTRYARTCILLPSFYATVVLLSCPRGTGDKGRNAFTHIKSRKQKVHWLKSLQEVVSRELGAPYTGKHVLDMGHIVLTPVDEWGWCMPYGTIPIGEDCGDRVAHPVAPPFDGRGAIPHSSSSSGVSWEDVWAMMHELAQPVADAFIAMIGEGTEVYGVVCPPPMSWRHLYSCLPV